MKPQSPSSAASLFCLNAAQCCLRTSMRHVASQMATLQRVNQWLCLRWVQKSPKKNCFGKKQKMMTKVKKKNKPSHTPETNILHLKMDGWKMNFLLGRPIFSGYLCFREGNFLKNRWWVREIGHKIASCFLMFFSPGITLEREESWDRVSTCHLSHMSPGQLSS